MTDETIRVQLGWSETVQYNSTITLDAAKVREWMVDSADVGGKTKASTAEITDKDVYDYLEYHAEESEWFEQCDTDKDFVSVSGRDIDHDGAEILPAETPLAVLVLTDNEMLRGAITTIAEATQTLIAFYGKDTMPDTETWDDAPIVLVGNDIELKVSYSSKYYRRGSVILVSFGPDTDNSVWRHAVDIGAEHVVILPDGTGWLVDRVDQD